MKKLAFLALVLFAAFAIASCAEDGEIDYALSFVSFKLTSASGPLDLTYGATEDCCAYISAGTLELRGAKGNDTFRLQITLPSEAPYDRIYQNCTASVYIGGRNYTGSVQTVTLAAVPDTAGEFVTGTFDTGTVSYNGENRTLFDGIIHLVFVNKAR